jgi:hypothetical protein
MSEREGDPLEGQHPAEKATPGAQRQIDALQRKLHIGLKAMATVLVLIVIGLAFTGWQIKRAFDHQAEERLARVGASASINTFLCQRIDSVGNGVAALVRVSLGQLAAPRAAEPRPASRLPAVRQLREGTGTPAAVSPARAQDRHADRRRPRRNQDHPDPAAPRKTDRPEP